MPTEPMTADAARALLPAGTCFLGGSVTEGTGKVRSYVHPGDGSALGEFRLAGADQVEPAVAAGRKVQPSWAKNPAWRRDALFAAAAAIRADADALAAVVTLEMGMPIRAAKAGVLQAAEWFAYYAGWADKVGGTVAPVAPGDVLDYTSAVPHGVVGAIIPWNGPVMAAALKLAPALAAGNAVVLKPSDLAPFSCVRLADTLGLPEGLVSVLGGAGDVGSALVEQVDMVSFTGGETAGRAVGTAAAARFVPCVLELGGKSASLVFDDADPVRVGKLAALLGAVQNSGQGCFLPTRLLVQRGIADAVLEAATAQLAKVRLGNPFEPTNSMGPVVDVAAADRILGVIEGASARLVAGGGRGPGPAYVEPTLFADVDPASRLAQEEVFGPVLAVTTFDTEDEAVELANGTRYGLAGYVWTNDLARAHRVADRLEAGYVCVNSLAGLPPSAPFGGWKASGRGTEGGREGMREFLRTKNVHVGLT
ncbi:aldehyde dehydrogenase family protein [Sporichthya brevicatena]|uniref:aldehyde dehydrogenase family protein n=1 Tax=Sporichthya brevicatena TaxID=171442 RepID=UPI0031DA92BD